MRGRASLHSKPPLYFLGDLVLTPVYISVLHLCLFLFKQFYVNANSACMEIKITKLDDVRHC